MNAKRENKNFATYDANFLDLVNFFIKKFFVLTTLN